ncbi:MAG TPA: glycosyltransferase family 1 protein [Bryobacteraceae bacterium]|nr:glycosyltransferase family 1 protein [Bryobacteraceae bacterium]
MRIALDATPLSAAGAGGIRRYTAELARALARGFPEDDFWLVSDQAFPCVAGSLSNLHCGGAPQTALDRRWWSFGLRRELGRLSADCFHGTDFSAPYRVHCPAVVTVHDLSPWREPFTADTSWRVRQRAGMLLRARVPVMVLTPSNAVRSEFLERFRYPPDRVVVTPLAASDVFRPVKTATERRSFIYVGASNRRRNPDVIIDAWREVRRTHDVDLVLAGRGRDPEPGLVVVPDENDEALARRYSSAAACLVPSLYEGFGLPLLEAMQCGCPVIASRDAALMEVSGGAAEHVEAGDAGGWRAAMDRVLTDASFSRAMQTRGLARAALFSWERTATLTREVYAEAVRRWRR